MLRDTFCGGKVSRLPFSIKFPMPGGALIRGIQDRVLKKRVFHVWTARPCHILFQDSPSYREAWLPGNSPSRLGNDLPTNYPGSGVENVTSVLPNVRDSACPALFDIKYATHAFLMNYSWGKGTVVRVRYLMHAATNMQSVREDQTRLDLVHNRQGARLDLSVKHVPFLS